MIEQSNVMQQDVEGIEDSSSDGWGDYPLDAVFVRSEHRSVGEVVQRIIKNRYILDPDFQRDFVWQNSKQSKLIESCIMRIPLPVFYVAEAKDGRIIVVDGLQRLTTFSRFIDNKFKLVGLVNQSERKGAHELEGKYFQDLPLNLQERILDTQLTMYILDAKAPERARLDIFERVNSGEPLTRQQMRNALYNGPATIWLKEASELEAFKSATDKSLNSKTMRDREAINRFCAFKLLGWQSYTTGDMDTFLANGLQKLAGLGAMAQSELLFEFEQSMLLNEKLFGQHAFRKSLVSESPWAGRTVINISLFEVCAVNFSHKQLFNINEASQNKLKEIVIDLVNSYEFGHAITSSTNSTIAVKDRFALFDLMVMEEFFR